MPEGPLASFLTQHPWPERMLARGKPLEWLWHFDLDVTAAELWPWVADTSRLNRAMGVPRMEFTEVNGARRGSTRNGGVLQEWVEIPWTWVARRTLTSIREYSRGFAWFLRGVYVIEELPESRVRLHVYFGWIPRGAGSRLILRLGFPNLEEQYRRVLNEIERHIREARQDSSPYSAPPPELEPDARARLDHITAELSRRVAGRVPEGLVERLTRHIETGDDMDLDRLKVLPLARAFHVSERDLLITCLHATRLGLLTLSWNVICPHCRGVREQATSLGDVPPTGSCDICDIEFENGGETSIEVIFHVHPSIRVIPTLSFCSAEPAHKRHIEVQIALGPGERRRVETALLPGIYRRRLRGDLGYVSLTVDEQSTTHDLAWTAGVRADSATCAPSPTIELENATAERQTFVIEDVRWSDDALRPSHLFNLQEFHDLFSQESLAAEVNLSVGEQTIMFTDMIGSTRFYEMRGDPEAFKEVRRHFAEVYEEVRKNRGAVIKTIGDAAMAAFANPVDALRAVAGIQARFDGARTDTPVRLRISINTGPCIAVNLNSAIDYFGRTVNLAAKLQSLVEAGQVVFPRSLKEAPGVAEFLKDRKAVLEELEFMNKALDHPMPVYRWDTGARMPDATAEAS